MSQTETFFIINPAVCDGCGECEAACAHNAVRRFGRSFRIDRHSCNGCGACVRFCHVRALLTWEQATIDLEFPWESDDGYLEDTTGAGDASGWPAAATTGPYDLYARSSSDLKRHFSILLPTAAFYLFIVLMQIKLFETGNYLLFEPAYSWVLALDLLFAIMALFVSSWTVSIAAVMEHSEEPLKDGKRLMLKRLIPLLLSRLLCDAVLVVVVMSTLLGLYKMAVWWPLQVAILLILIFSVKALISLVSFAIVYDGLGLFAGLWEGLNRSLANFGKVLIFHLFSELVNILFAIALFMVFIIPLMLVVLVSAPTSAGAFVVRFLTGFYFVALLAPLQVLLSLATMRLYTALGDPAAASQPPATAEAAPAET